MTRGRKWALFALCLSMSLPPLIAHFYAGQALLSSSMFFVGIALILAMVYFVYTAKWLDEEK